VADDPQRGDRESQSATLQPLIIKTCCGVADKSIVSEKENKE